MTMSLRILEELAVAYLSSKVGDLYGANQFSLYDLQSPVRCFPTTVAGTSVALLGFGLYLLYYAVTNSTGTSFADFQQLFSQQRLVHVSTIDLTILSLAVSDNA